MRGFADVHNHQFSYLGFGGLAFHGRAFGDIQKALPWCDFIPGTIPPVPRHGPGGTGDLVGQAMAMAYGHGGSGIGHLVGGNPQFDGWPRWDSVTHQSVYEEWLFRALTGGLRLMVVLAVNNEFLCGLVNRVLSCNDMEATDRQLAAVKEMEAHIDKKNGGLGKGWYRIVYSPEQARRVMDAGKLAVVLGIEVDYLFNARPGAQLTRADIVRELDRYYARGVRHVFPIHFGDNLFGGTAFQNDLEAALDYFPGTAVNPITPLSASVGRPYSVKTEDGRRFGYEYRGGRRNVRGLSDLGKFLIREIMARGMIIDVDHMSARSRADTLEIAESMGYPVVSGHTGFNEISRGEKNHEGQLLPREVERIRALGGMVNVIPHQGGAAEILTWRASGQTVVEHACGNTTESFAQAYLYAVSKMGGAPVGIGTDFNGFAGLPGPRFGEERCPGGTNTTATQHLKRVSYPFTAAASGAQMPQSVVGQKTFDVNDDGLAHVGLLPDFIADCETLGLAPSELDPLLNSAEGYIEVWQTASASRFRFGDHFYATDLAERDNAVRALGYEPEGVACHVFPQQVPDTAPLYRLSSATGDHYYTMSAVERASAIQAGYQDEHVACYVYPQPAPGSAPLFRLVHARSGYHLYTTSSAERDSVVRNVGYVSEGAVGHVLTTAQNAVPLYRMFGAPGHFYTASLRERDEAIRLLGYQPEGISGYILPRLANGATALFRLYNPTSRDHFYTTDASERDSAVRQHGYTSEGVAGYVFPQQIQGAVALHRLWNPSVRDHFYTADASERDRAVVQYGYTSEGVVGHVYAGPHRTVPLYRVAKLGPWSSLDAGHFQSSDLDDIDFRIERAVVDPSKVEFLLRLGPGVTWKKVLNMPDGQGSSWDIVAEGVGGKGTNGLWAHQVHNGQSLTFRKAKFLGVMTDVFTLRELDGLTPGSRVTFIWVKDGV